MRKELKQVTTFYGYIRLSITIYDDEQNTYRLGTGLTFDVLFVNREDIGEVVEALNEIVLSTVVHKDRIEEKQIALSHIIDVITGRVRRTLQRHTTHDEIYTTSHDISTITKNEVLKLRIKV